MSDALQALSAARPEMPVRPSPVQQKPPIAILGKDHPSPVKSGGGSPRAESANGAEARQTRKEIKEAVDRLNEAMRKEGRDLAFSMDEKLNQTIITVKNAQTGEVVRQIPDKVLLRVAHSIDEMKGLLYDQGS